MRIDKLHSLTLAAGCAALLPSLAAARTEAQTSKPQFADPIRIQAGDKDLGAGRLYPSPTMHDVDGDGVRDLVIGDLFGKVTWARGIKGTGASVSFEAEKPLNAANGKPLKFHNW